MTQLAMQFPAAVQARRSGLRRARQMGETLRARYRALLEAHADGFTDHEAGAQLGVLSTTAGARRLEWMAASPGCIEAAGRVAVPCGTSRTRWRWVR